MKFCYYEPKFKVKNKKKSFFGKKGVGGREGGGARVSDFCFHKESESKKKNAFFWGGGWDEGAGGRGRGRWMDRRTGPNQFAPSTSSKLGA